jgi:nucleoside phosphorylase
MRVLVTYAVEAEFAPWRKLRDLRRRELGGRPAFEAEIGRARVDFVVTGMGPGNALKGAEAAMSEPHDICIASGFAGSLQAEHRVGDVLAAQAVQQIGKRETIECARNLFRAACSNQAVAARMFLTSDHLITKAAEKEQLAPFGDAVDMESFATLSMAKRKRLAAVAIRVISDRFDEDMPADIDTTVDANGRVLVRGVAKHLARHPLQLPALIRLGRQTRTAAEALAHYLEAFLKELSFRSHGWPPQELREVASQ